MLMHDGTHILGTIQPSSLVAWIMSFLAAFPAVTNFRVTQIRQTYLTLEWDVHVSVHTSRYLIPVFTSVGTSTHLCLPHLNCSLQLLFLVGIIFLTRVRRQGTNHWGVYRAPASSTQYRSCSLEPITVYRSGVCSHTEGMDTMEEIVGTFHHC